MQLSDLPTWFAKRWGGDATSSYIRAVPATTADPNAASMSLGFPPNTFVAEGAGGSPPDGRDFNGILNFLSAWVQWFGAGAPVPYNPAVSSNGGYPRGSVVLSASTPGLLWESTTDGNTTNPEGSSPAGWVARVGRRATTGDLQAGTNDLVVPTAKGLVDAGYDPVVSQFISSSDASGYRVYRSGYKECWGRRTVPAASQLRVTMPVTHTNGIQPSIGAEIAVGTGTPNLIGLRPVEVNAFVLVNNDTTDRVVYWSTKGV